ncbi:MAG: bifunctional folylpolyglutamate synthase/dihydrofolate synthase [Clostridia bacterium]|nr:bifunctional folylpolyglutamate synthase/dihydrofolate synthase [Clostridia bacterium]
MNYNEALSYIHQIPKFRRPLGNENLSKLLKAMGNPQDGLKFIHVAGTNGKGSTSAMIAEILKQSGYKTGLFTSPFIEVFNERMRIDGINISNSDLSVYTERVKNAMEQNNAPVSEFAFVTAAAFLYFYEKQCDFVVLEVGMGGKLDATNVISESLVSVICKIGFDHTQYLGNTLEEIALEKCGIIRRGGTVVSYPNGSLNSLIKDYAKKMGAELIFAENAEGEKNGFIYKEKKYPLSLKGAYQPQNAAVALEVIDVLRKKGVNITDNDVLEGLKTVRWEARFEFVADNVIIDGGHNIDGIKALKKSLLDLNREIVLVTAMMADKDFEACIREIAPIAKTIVATEVDMPRCLDADIIGDIVRGMNKDVIVNTDIDAALKIAVNAAKGGVVCVCGSLFLAGEARKKFLKKEK